MSQAVIVVPTLDPMIRKAASLNASIPAFTKLTTITVTADDDWISEVAKKPVVQAPNRLEATARSAFLKPLPAIRCTASLMTFIP